MADSFYWAILGCATTIGIISSVALLNLPAQSVPPTPAFSEVYINGYPITAETFNDKLYITTEGMITTTITGKTVTMKLAEMNCPILQGFRGIDADGNLICGVI